MTEIVRRRRRPEQQQLELPAALPVLPLKETVVFPQSMIAARDRAGALDPADRRRRRRRPAARARHREGRRRSSRPAGTTSTRSGTVALVHKMIKIPDGTLRILVAGIAPRAGSSPSRHRAVPASASSSALPDVIDETPEVEALTRNVQSLFARIIGLAPYLPEELQLAAANVDDPSALAHLVASTLRTITTEERQELLEQAERRAAAAHVSAILAPRGSRCSSSARRSSRRSSRRWRRASASTSCASS